MNIKTSNIIQPRKEVCNMSNVKSQIIGIIEMIDSPSPNSSESEKTNIKILNWFNYKKPSVNNNLIYFTTK